MPILNMVYYVAEWGGRLPSEYQEVEYIQSSWECRIDTWYIGNWTYQKLLYKFNPVTYTSGWDSTAFFGTVPNGQNYLTASSDGTKFQFWCGDSDIYLWSMARDTVYEVEDIRDNWNLSVKINWTTYTGTYTWSLNSTNQMPLFCFLRNINNYIRHATNTKLYYFKIYTSANTLVRDLVPCYRKSDNVIGMYDIVNNQFYTNAWSWAFTKWGNV